MRVSFRTASGKRVSFATRARRPGRAAATASTSRARGTVSFRTASGKRVSFAAAGGAKPARRGSWPKGKVPPHLKKFLFR